MHVKNLKWGPSGPRPLPQGYKSWLAYWVKNYGGVATICTNKECTNRATVGGHVMPVDGKRSNNWFIIPLCDDCNSPQYKEDFVVEHRHMVGISIQLS
ncbi:MAG: hypothetical protein P8N47_00330 [Bacteroidia bacterium]|jgi:hypothetical protein|nr:hypothetical protein [Bacteroidia bacterium]